MTTEFDLATWEKSSRDPVQVASEAKVTAAGTGEAVSGLDVLDSGELVVSVHLRKSSSSGAGPALSVIVEESDDGVSWSTLETFAFSASGASSATVATPPAYLRARWSVDAGEWSVSVLFVPAEGNVPGGTDGGSQPGAVRLLDLGVVTLANLGDTLYTPAAGELVGPVFLRDVVYLTDGGVFVSLLITGDTVALAGWDSDLARDGFGYAANPPNVDDRLAIAPTSMGPVGVGMGPSGASDAAFSSTNWEPLTPYTLNANPAIVAVSHIWTIDDDGTSGGSEPDFAGNIGGTVVDNDITWTDQGVLGDGSAHVYAYVATPDTP